MTSYEKIKDLPTEDIENIFSEITYLITSIADNCRSTTENSGCCGCKEAFCELPYAKAYIERVINERCSK